MSSARESCIISSQNLGMLKSVLSGLGFDHRMIDIDEKLYNGAARKVIELFQEGLTDPAELKEEMLFLFGVQKHDNIHAWRPLPRYAIQGLPLFYLR